MFDNLRDDSSFYEAEQADSHKEPEVQVQPAVVKQRKHNSDPRALGMTAQQRFILAFLLMITVCVMGMLAMFVTGRMGLF